MHLLQRIEKRHIAHHTRPDRHIHLRNSFSIAEPPDLQLPAGLQLLRYEITPDALDRPEEKVPGLDEALDSIREKLFDDCHNNPQAAIPVMSAISILLELPTLRGYDCPRRSG